MITSAITRSVIIIDLVLEAGSVKLFLTADSLVRISMAAKVTEAAYSAIPEADILPTIALV